MLFCAEQREVLRFNPLCTSPRFASRSIGAQQKSGSHLARHQPFCSHVEPLLGGPFDSSQPRETSSDGLVTFPPSDPKSPERTDPGPIRPPSFDGLSG